MKRKGHTGPREYLQVEIDSETIPVSYYIEDGTIYVSTLNYGSKAAALGMLGEEWSARQLTRELLEEAAAKRLR